MVLPFWMGGVGKCAAVLPAGVIRDDWFWCRSGPCRESGVPVFQVVLDPAAGTRSSKPALNVVAFYFLRPVQDQDRVVGANNVDRAARLKVVQGMD